MTFENYTYGDKLRYVGPSDFDGEWAAPEDYEQPYTFKHVSMGGTLSCLTRFNGRKNLSPDHPANNPNYWEQVE